MPKYRVTATMSIDLFTFIEAPNELEAWDIARELDGGQFKEEKQGGDWSIDGVYLVEESENGTD